MLLGMLVNKVGDPEHKIASKASHLLSTLGKSLDEKHGLYMLMYLVVLQDQ